MNEKIFARLLAFSAISLFCEIMVNFLLPFSSSFGPEVFVAYRYVSLTSKVLGLIATTVSVLSFSIFFKASIGSFGFFLGLISSATNFFFGSYLILYTYNFMNNDVLASISDLARRAAYIGLIALFSFFFRIRKALPYRTAFVDIVSIFYFLNWFFLSFVNIWEPSITLFVIGTCGIVLTILLSIAYLKLAKHLTKSRELSDNLS